MAGGVMMNDLDGALDAVGKGLAIAMSALALYATVRARRDEAAKTRAEAAQREALNDRTREELTNQVLARTKHSYEDLAAELEAVRRELRDVQRQFRAVLAHNNLLTAELVRRDIPVPPMPEE